MSVETGGGFPPERLIAPDDTTLELDQRFDILFASLPDEPNIRTHSGHALFVTERDEILFAREGAVRRVAEILTNPNTAETAAQYIAERHTEPDTPKHALYVYMGIVAQITEQDGGSTNTFIRFVEHLAETEQDTTVQTTTDRTRLRILEIAYPDMGLGELSFAHELNEDEEAEIMQPLIDEYDGLLGALERYQEKAQHSVYTHLTAARTAFDELPRSRHKRHDKHLLKEVMDPSIFARHITEGAFRTAEGTELARRLHDVQLYYELNGLKSINMRLAAVTKRFLTRITQDRAAIKFDYDIIHDEALRPDEVRGYIDSEVLLTNLGRDTLRSRHDVEMYERTYEDVDRLEYAYANDMFVTEAGREAARQRLIAYGVDVIELDEVSNAISDTANSDQ